MTTYLVVQFNYPVPDPSALLEERKKQTFTASDGYLIQRCTGDCPGTAFHIFSPTSGHTVEIEAVHARFALPMQTEPPLKPRVKHSTMIVPGEEIAYTESPITVEDASDRDPTRLPPPPRNPREPDPKHKKGPKKK